MSVLKFLVVDDAAFIRDLLKKNLRNYFPGCEILDAASAKKAQMLLKSNRVDLILCDWEMPEMTGEEFLRWVRAEEAYRSLPFIMVTSRGERDFIIKAVQAGVSDYLGKPFTPEGLVGKVTKALTKVGKAVTSKLPEASNSSLDVLTSGSMTTAIASTTTASTTASTETLVKPANDSVSILTASTAAVNTPTSGRANPAAKSTSQKPSSRARGQAMLTFAGFNTQCVISAITLQTLTGAIKREDRVPSIFETVVISIVQNDGGDVARLNGYLHSIQAGENNIDAGVLKLVIRFVDDDPQKMEQLSRYIAKLP